MNDWIRTNRRIFWILFHTITFPISFVYGYRKFKKTVPMVFTPLISILRLIPAYLANDKPHPLGHSEEEGGTRLS